MKHFVLAVFLLYSQIIFAQNQDSLHIVLQKANIFISVKDFDGAFNILRDFNLQRYDVSSLRLQAQVAYWMQLFPVADSLYRVAVNKSPDLPALNMEYGRFLFETGTYSEAYAWLEKAAQQETFQAEAELYLAYIDYWQRRLPMATQRAQDLVKRFPDYENARLLLDELLNAGKLHVMAGLHFQSDDQPFRQTRSKVKLHAYRNRWLAPEVSVEAAWLNPDVFDAVQTLESWVGNGFQLGSGGPEIKLKGGLLMHPEFEMKYLFDITMNQKLTKGVHLSLNINKRPYQFTINSVPLALTPKLYSIAVDLDHPKHWLGKAAWEQQEFEDGNQVHTVYAWAMSPIVNSKKILLRLGYGFNYANSDTLRFVMKPSNRPPLEGEQQGWFNPYFTPVDQQIHALLAGGYMRLGKDVRMNWNASYGLWAQNTTRYFYRTQQGGGAPVLTGTVPVTYHPTEFNISFELNLSPKLILVPSYQFQKLFFYTSNRAGLAIQW